MANLYEVMESGFDINEIEDAAPRDPLPEGEYVLIVEKTELLPNKANSGYRLDIMFSVEDGPHTGRKLFMTYNISHTNEQARNIARREYKSLAGAIGVDPVIAWNDSESIHHKPFLGHVTLRNETVKDGFGQRVAKIDPKTGYPYPPRNSIDAYRPIGGFSAPVQPAAAPPQAAVPQQTRPVQTTVAPASAARPAAPQAGNPFGRR